MRTYQWNKCVNHYFISSVHIPVGPFIDKSPATLLTSVLNTGELIDQNNVLDSDVLNLVSV